MYISNLPSSVVTDAGNLLTVANLDLSVFAGIEPWCPSMRFTELPVYPVSIDYIFSDSAKIYPITEKQLFSLDGIPCSDLQLSY